MPKLTQAELSKLIGGHYEESMADAGADLLLKQGLLSEAMNLAQGSPKTNIPFRAAYALEKAFLKEPDRFVPYYARFVSDFSTAQHPSVWRHYGKIMATLLRSGQLNLSEGQSNTIAETAVLRLLDESIPVGVRVWSLDILYYLRGRLSWIDKELPGILEDLKIDPTPAMVSRLRRFGWMRKRG